MRINNSKRDRTGRRHFYERICSFSFFLLLPSKMVYPYISIRVLHPTHSCQSTVRIREWYWALFMGAIHCCFWDSILLIIYRPILNRFKELWISIFIRKLTSQCLFMIAKWTELVEKIELLNGSWRLLWGIKCKCHENFIIIIQNASVWHFNVRTSIEIYV